MPRQFVGRPFRAAFRPGDGPVMKEMPGLPANFFPLFFCARFRLPFCERAETVFSSRFALYRGLPGRA
jgi:hypothetical protein